MSTVTLTHYEPSSGALVTAKRPRSKRRWGSQAKYSEDLCDHLYEWMLERTRDRKIMVPVSVVNEEGVSADGNFPGKQKTELRAVTAQIPQISDWCFEVGISIKTAQNWAYEKPEFGAAYARARQMQETFVRDGVADGTISGNVGAFLMKNMFRNNAAGYTPLCDGAGGWSDRQETVQITEQAAPIDISKLTPGQLEAFEQVLKLCESTGVKIRIENVEGQ
jgi:hypothetical protein